MCTASPSSYNLSLQPSYEEAVDISFKLFSPKLGHKSYKQTSAPCAATARSDGAKVVWDAVVATRESRRVVKPGRNVIYAAGRCGGGVMVPSQTGDDALTTVPVNEYETVFSFPTVGENSEMCRTR